MRPLIIIVLIKVMAVNVYPRRVLPVRKNIRAVRILGVNRDAESVVGEERQEESQRRVLERKGGGSLEVSREIPGGGGDFQPARVENKGRRSGKGERRKEAK
jgi:hypothetical protein